MSRIQLALNVTDLDAAVDFYSKLFRTEPAKRRPGYANFAVSDPPLKLVLLETGAPGGSINHLGVEVFSTDEVAAATERLVSDGVETRNEDGVTCCYATQDKVWVTDPDGARWEVYTVLDDAEVMACVDDATCSLEDAAKDERVDEIAQTLAGVVLDRQRTATGARLVLKAGTEEKVREIVAKEQVCCGFLDYAITSSPEGVVLEITGPEEAKETLDAWAGAFGEPSSAETTEPLSAATASSACC